MKNHHDSIGVNRPGHVYYSFSFAKYIKKYKRLFPLLLIYVIILLVFGNNELFADEVRFLTYAKNIVNHGYIFNPQDPQILNGWPYAILLVPLSGDWGVLFHFQAIERSNAVFCSRAFI
jgi:dolichyl-phosphate-mannose--protein O-mannosyl transferase